MSKKKEKKVVQMLSPENYIRKRSRTLPIYKCWAMKDWEEIGKTHIIVSRKHVNGNISFCFYLVDLFCLGVKDTYFYFNTDETDLMDRISNENQEVEFEEISYTLAHNIIFSAIEFAEEYGFQAHKDFARTTKYFLEEDDDKVEYMDIECGKDGKPMYIDDGEDATTAKKIVNQLEKTAGKGNYEYIQGGFNDIFDSSELTEDIEQQKYLLYALQLLPKDLKTKVFGMEPEKVYKMALEYDMDSDNIYEIDNAIKLKNYCLMFYADKDEIDQQLTQFEDLFADISITNEFIGEMIEDKNHQTSLFSNEIQEIISELDEISFSDTKDISEERMDEIIRKYPDYPVFYYYKYLNIDLLNNNENKILDYIKLFPEATLLRMSNDRVNSLDKLKNQDLSKIFSKYFSDKKQINSTELYELFLTFALKLTMGLNLEGIIALELYLEDHPFNEDKEESVWHLTSQVKEKILDGIMKRR
jgi:hypothetical protein